MTRKLKVLIIFAVAILALLLIPKVSVIKNQDTEMDTAPTNHNPINAVDIDTTDVEKLFEQRAQELVWRLDESAFDRAKEVKTWASAETSYGLLCKKMLGSIFSNDTISQDEQTVERRHIVLSSGIAVDIYKGSMMLQVADAELFRSLYTQSLEKMVTDGLPECLGVTLRLYDETDGQRTYAIYADDIPIDTVGYGVQGDYVAGVYVKCFDEDDVLICLPHLPTEEKEVLQPSEMLSIDVIKTICKADLLSQYDTPIILILEDAVLTYYFQQDTQTFIPAWRISGQLYDGEYHKTSRLIVATTGELHWG